MSNPQLPAPTSYGVIIYRMDMNGNIEGTFALAQYGGALAREIGKKMSDNPGSFAGEYSVTTFRPDNRKFADGRMIADPLGNQGAYRVRWVLRPVEEALQELGYVSGTELIYDAIGITLDGGKDVSVAWDNSVFTRKWPGGSDAAQSRGLSQATRR
ncbi:hypothetical protein [Sorangium sp. So ce861]|uniref:hypothetical protein n=1 Tax=Sorangium sp. So ce861 TaxID=3133323 RepID=UPI003F6124CF